MESLEPKPLVTLRGTAILWTSVVLLLVLLWFGWTFANGEKNRD
jgi:hypothetical protein